MDIVLNGHLLVGEEGEIMTLTILLLNNEDDIGPLRIW